MLDMLRMLIADSLPTVADLDPPIHPGDLRVAACALLIEIALTDDEFSRDEQAVIVRALTSYFGVDERGALELMGEAERQLATAADDASFTRQLVAEYDDEQRVLLADLVWRVARADGLADRHEAFLAARLEQWLGITSPPASPPESPLGT